MSNIFFHEDDYCQIEILPKENYNYCLVQCSDIEDFANQHMDEDGIGFTDIYISEGNEIPLSTLNLSNNYLETCIKKILPNFDSVETGYSSYRIKAKNTCAYGLNENVTVFFNYDGNGIVQNIWLTLDIHDEIDIINAEKLLLKLSEVSELLIVDWGWGEVYLLTDAHTIHKYLERREIMFNS